MLHPELIESTWGETEDAAGKIIAANAEIDRPQCLLDLSELKYLSSAQVALLVRVWKGVRANDGQFVVVAPHATVREVLAVAGLDKLIQIYPTRDVAQSVLQSWSRHSRTWWTWPLLVVALLGTAAGATGLLLPPRPEFPRTAQQALQFAGAGVGFLAGLALLMICQNWWRWIGAIAVAAAFAIALISLDHVRRGRLQPGAGRNHRGVAAPTSHLAHGRFVSPMPGPSTAAASSAAIVLAQASLGGSVRRHPSADPSAGRPRQFLTPDF